ncbi:hypothetical protein RFI_16696 [Reticulomyxa filosa]|uniref:Uncharacterized protein n=1 Tax=Reticulomyxa filosa TaxID=46433 RepID=X6N5D7_RETFI|nr:hypothetical protein RFI_16696 [Reticulomyxa filosa]|eukprot:ETO20522.1 hypothetical protein RFI_16696 [Reticulomyxa filosa]
MNPNMAFFIEIPYKLDSFQYTADILYTLFQIRVSDNQCNSFQFGKAQYCIKWIKEFQADNLNVENFQVGYDRSIPPMIHLIDLNNFKSSFSPLASSTRNLLHQIIFFKFLFTQFKILVDSKLLENKLVEISDQLFFIDANAKENNTQFCLCKFFLMSKLQRLWTLIMESTIKIPSNDVIFEEKKKRIAVLYRTMGVPEAKKDAITKKLCEKEFKRYVLTYDNILKMITIFSIFDPSGYFCNQIVIKMKIQKSLLCRKKKSTMQRESLSTIKRLCLTCLSKDGPKKSLNINHQTFFTITAKKKKYSF